MTVYSIPDTLYPAFPGRPAILRTADPAGLKSRIGPSVPEGIAFVQISPIACDMTPLEDWGEGLPIDLTLADPASELPWLYRCTGLLARHPVRVTVPLRPGMARAAKLALSLGFAVRLTGHRPVPEAVAEARHALDLYLHNPTVEQPVEPFQGLLLAFLHDMPVDLWSLLEENPEAIEVLDQQGQVEPDRGPASATDFRDFLVASGADCAICPWLAVCGGYFQWPRADYDCSGVKALFDDLRAAATELRQALADYSGAEG
jgi:hypothetical protein